MVFACIREHASSVFIFASTSCQIFLASSEHFRNTDGEQRALRVLRKFSASRNLSFINRTRYFVLVANNLADTSKTEQ